MPVKMGFLLLNCIPEPEQERREMANLAGSECPTVVQRHENCLFFFHCRCSHPWKEPVCIALCGHKAREHRGEREPL